MPHWNPVLHCHGDGVTLFFKVGRDCSRWRTWVMRSADGGRSWSEAEELVRGNIGGRGPVKNKCIELSDGTWLAPGSSEIGRWQAFVDRSADGGRTWTRSKLIPQSRRVVGTTREGREIRFGVIQPTLWESEPGRVHMLLRSSCGRICRSDSGDGGRTWDRVYETELPNNNSGIDLARLSGGELLLACNPVAENWGPRWPLRLLLSRDGGTSWATLAEPDSEPGREYSYPAVIALRDGGAAVTYTRGRRQIAFVRLARNEMASGGAV